MIMIMMSLPSFGSSSQASVTILEDFQMDTWSMGPNVPYPVHAAMTATTVGKYIYVCGGIYMQAAKNPTNPSQLKKEKEIRDIFFVSISVF